MAKKAKSEGIPLNKAWWHFASRRLKKAHSDAEDSSPPPTPKSYPDDPRDRSALAWKSLGTHLEYISLQSAPRFQMQRELRNKLVDGELLARGYRTKPDIQKAADEIPAYVFQGKIDWEKSAVTNDNQKYEGVVVYPIGASDTRAPVAEHDVRDTTIATLQQESRPGPKSMGPLVIQTYESLEKSGAFKNLKTIKDRAKRIIGEIEKDHKYKSTRGLELKSIYRHLRQHLTDKS